MSIRRIKGLDTVRAVAVLLVIIIHWGPHSSANHPVVNFFLQKMLPRAGFAVDFFFVLSGFLITNILLKSKNDSDSTSRFHLIKIFVFRRCLRIFPIYYLCLGFLIIINYPQIRHNSIYFVTYTSNFLSFINRSWNSFSHTWSLAVEEQFYLIWPFIIIFLPNKHILKAILFFIGTGTLLEYFTEAHYGPFAAILTFNCINAFAIGALYSYALADEKLRKVITNAITYALPVAITLVIFQMKVIHFLPDRFINAVISINLIIYISENKYGTLVGYIINNKVLNSLGKVSYGMYLYHYAIPYLYNRFFQSLEKRISITGSLIAGLHNPVIAEILQFLCLLAISYLSFYLVEEPILRLKKYMNYVPAKNKNYTSQH